jgi:hypothetical protein
MKHIIVFSMLLMFSNASLLDGPYGDGKFLAHPTVSALDPCPVGQFNALVVDVAGTGVANHDGAAFIAQCKSCDATYGKVKFMTDSTGDKAGYQDVIVGLVGDAAVFNREECCYNSNNVICIEQLREYNRACSQTGEYVVSTNEAGYGTSSTCL